MVETDTLPVTRTVEVPAPRNPPLRLSPPWALRLLFDVVREPAETVRTPDAVNWLSWLIVPETVTAANDCPADRLIVFEAPVNVTVDDVAVMLKMDEEYQLPAIEMVADWNVSAAVAPELTRSELNVVIDDVRVKVPVKVSALVKVVEIPALTVRFATTVGTLMVPVEAETTTVLVPGVNVPAEVSMLMTVIAEPSPRRMPPTPIVSVPAVKGKFEPAAVSSVVVPLASFT